MKINLEGEEILDKFVEQLVQDKGVENQELEKNRLKELLSDKIDEGMLMALPGERLVALNKEMDNAEPSEERINAIVYGSGVDFGKVTLEVMEKFRKDYLGGEK